MGVVLKNESVNNNNNNNDTLIKFNDDTLIQLNDESIHNKNDPALKTMGLRSSEPNLNLKTRDLANWISKVRNKRMSVKRRRRNNLYVEAMLKNALIKAETELRHKQMLRKERWLRIRSEWTAREYGGGISKRDSDDLEMAWNHSPKAVVWDSRTCEELNSLDSFMMQLKDVKCHKER